MAGFQAVGTSRKNSTKDPSMTGASLPAVSPSFDELKSYGGEWDGLLMEDQFRGTQFGTESHKGSEIEPDLQKREKNSAPLLKNKSENIKQAMFFALSLLAVVCVAVALKRRSMPKKVAALPPLPLDGLNIDELLMQFRMESMTLNKRWNAASNRVKSAFIKYYMPSSEDQQYLSQSAARESYERHIRAMEQAVRPGQGASREQQWEYLTHLKLLSALCRGANERLRLLGGLDLLASEHGIPVPVLDQPATKSWPILREAEKDIAMTFHEFLDLIPRGHLRYANEGSVASDEACISRRPARKFSDVVRMGDKFTDCDYSVCEKFEPVVNAFGLSLILMEQDYVEQARPLKTPCDETPFATNVFLRTLGIKFEKAKERSVRSVLRHAAQKWNDHTVDMLAEKFLGEHADRLADQVREKRKILQLAREKQGIADNHLFALSLFLL
ncbi:uncharacterized protein LOC34620038 [Cyclospora cayetanensis]|uniref:Uncharacterized protein LOC34620038 n=2 Tax=Cyclospora cayetanensis TaxID=88456 RepID=A0A6P5WE33_9EIME|nr:uncharacterized protein LOC34620038 [Cyclospora cayetanensis]OEH79139.1 hypothetical protein cyc_03330 [Cyclospora cayetanensis]